MPAGPLVVRESTEDCSIDGYEIPKGARVFVNVWGLGRDPNQWENPLEFRPESGGKERSSFWMRGDNTSACCHLGVEEEAALELH
ncbi:hypothetical protein PVK06_031556 [Gossypium arboreum]|uniref:Uncharacterized protein n=1 Tax=Gossypium arboreum TaxID=29729 RepID=A0ABR0NRC5_GOSAR|nr:hypothetical protein PVK06_031556 [Gossypium arboreum]